MLAIVLWETMGQMENGYKRPSDTLNRSHLQMPEDDSQRFAQAGCWKLNSSDISKDTKRLEQGSAGLFGQRSGNNWATIRKGSCTWAFSTGWSAGYSQEGWIVISRFRAEVVFISRSWWGSLCATQVRVSDFCSGRTERSLSGLSYVRAADMQRSGGCGFTNVSRWKSRIQ